MTRMCPQLGVLVEIIDDDFRNGIALELDDDAHALLVGFVADVGDIVELLVVDKPGDILDQRGLINVVGDLADD